jgi:hypothetical protein
MLDSNGISRQITLELVTLINWSTFFDASAFGLSEIKIRLKFLGYV